MGYSGRKKNILLSKECLAVYRLLNHFLCFISFLKAFPVPRKVQSYTSQVKETSTYLHSIFLLFHVMETNSQIMSAFCGNALKRQNCRVSPSALKFFPEENRTGLLCSRRSKAEDDGCCWQQGRHGKGHAPKQGAGSPGTSSQL